jgi:hypothetical protein
VWLRTLVVTMLLGCTSELPAPAPVVPVKPRVVVVQPKAPPVVPESDEPSGSLVQVSAGAAVPIQIRFYTVSGLHQGYFARAKGVRALGEGMGLCTPDPVTVDVSWKQAKLEGRILAIMPEKLGACAPSVSGRSVDVAALLPMSKALSAWRTYVAATSDLRINAFQVGLQFGEGDESCVMFVGGQHPADGSTFVPCVEIGGEKVCAEGDVGTKLKFADAAQHERLVRCLGI